MSIKDDAKKFLEKDEENFRNNSALKAYERFMRRGFGASMSDFHRQFMEGAGIKIDDEAGTISYPLGGPPPEKTVVEKAKDLLEMMADYVEDKGLDGAADAAEMREVAEGLLAADQFEAVVIVLARMSKKPKRLVKRVLKSKLNVTGA